MTTCYGIKIPDGSVIHVHADRLWHDNGALIICEDRENPDYGKNLDEPVIASYTTMVFAPGQWLQVFSASIVDGSPLSVVDYSACKELAERMS